MEKLISLLSGGLVGGLCWYAPDLMNVGEFWPVLAAMAGGVVAALFFSRSITFYHFGVVSCVVLVFSFRWNDFQDVQVLVPVLLSYVAVVAVSYTAALLTDYITQIIKIRRST